MRGRKINFSVRTAFLAKKKFSCSNTKVIIENGQPHMYLHGNCIAKMNDEGDILINHCGWETPTTQGRLSSLPDVNIRSVKGSFVLNNVYIMEREWINVKYYTLKHYL